MENLMIQVRHGLSWYLKAVKVIFTKPFQVIRAGLIFAFLFILPIAAIQAFFYFVPKLPYGVFQAISTFYKTFSSYAIYVSVFLAVGAILPGVFNVGYKIVSEGRFEAKDTLRPISNFRVLLFTYGMLSVYLSLTWLLHRAGLGEGFLTPTVSIISVSRDFVMGALGVFFSFSLLSCLSSVSRGESVFDESIYKKIFDNLLAFLTCIGLATSLRLLLKIEGLHIFLVAVLDIFLLVVTWIALAVAYTEINRNES